MIYQFYHAPAHRLRLFRDPLYRGFGLEPEVNSAIQQNCPELTTPENRILLVEFGGMLHLWRNPPPDNHSWIGFTSYRQRDKTNVYFHDAGEIEYLLQRWDGIAWLPNRFDIPLAGQAERAHPGILAFLERMNRQLERTTPWAFSQIHHGYFASYFLLPKRSFQMFMDWVYPAITYGLSQQNDAYIRSHPKSLGFLLERLFIIWYLVSELRILNYPRYRSFCSEDWHQTYESEALEG